jgi:ribonuclease HII
MPAVRELFDDWGLPKGAPLCGLDEAGRGPLAGPVTAAAVLLPEDFPEGVLADSKALSERRREEAFALVVDRALAWSIAWAWPSEIDRFNILEASMLTMRRAFAGLDPALLPRGLHAVVDGNRLPGLPVPTIALVKADAKVPAVMAASILAKVARDRAMERWGALYPEYGYARHKGYPTAAHREACRRLGPSPIQRLSFSYR